MSVKDRKTEIEINTIIKKLDDRPTWLAILEALCNNKDYAVTVWEILQYILEHTIYKPYASNINRTLNRMKIMGIVNSMEIKGLRGKRWYLTEKGLNFCERLFPSKEKENQQSKD